MCYVAAFAAVVARCIAATVVAAAICVAASAITGSRCVTVLHRCSNGGTRWRFSSEVPGVAMQHTGFLPDSKGRGAATADGEVPGVLRCTRIFHAASKHHLGAAAAGRANRQRGPLRRRPNRPGRRWSLHICALWRREENKAVFISVSALTESDGYAHPDPGGSDGYQPD